VDVRDVVAGAIAAADRAPAGRKYLLSDNWRPLADVARIVARITGTTGPRAIVPRALAQACSPLAESVCTLVGRTPLYIPYSVHALCGHRLVSHERAAADLKYAPRRLEVTLTDTCRWFEDNGYLPRGACKEATT